MVLLFCLSRLFSLLCLTLSLLFTFHPDLCNTLSAAIANDDYLKLSLVHRNPLQSPFEALSSDIHRISALHRRQRIPKLPLTSGAATGSGQYFVDLNLGTPPQRLLLVADTGSDLVWVKCSACRNCSNHSPGSAFLARQSASFSPHHCFDSACRLVPHPNRVRCNRTRLHSPCRYEYLYGDGSTSSGIFAAETMTFNTSAGKEVNHNGLLFGCGFHKSGPSVSGPSFVGAQGVMGLGRGPISLSSQLGSRFGKKFSYCLMDYTISPSPISYLLIGGSQNGAVSVKSRMNYTPLQVNPVVPTFYYIGIQSVSVGGVKLQINPSIWAIDESGNGGTVVDSGTTLSFLADPAYDKILVAFKRRVKLPKPAVPSPRFDLCVNVSGVARPRLPRLSFKLVGGSVFSPPPRNYFLDTAVGVKCLAIQPVSTSSGFSIIGNLMQQGFMFEFDKDRSRLGFTRQGCGLP